VITVEPPGGGCAGDSSGAGGTTSLFKLGTTCDSSMFVPPSVGGPDLLRALTGRTDPAAEAVLAAGGAVVFDAADLATPAPHATVRLAVTGQGCAPGGGGDPACSG
jgi:hypothetical protein